MIYLKYYILLPINHEIINFMNNLGDIVCGMTNGVISCVKVLLRSQIIGNKPKITASANPEIVILGNGPSLKKFLEEKTLFLCEKDLLAVNYSVQSEYFTQLKPRYYVAIDPVVFRDPAFSERLFRNLAEKVSWNLDLFVPYNVRNKTEWQRYISDNKFITTHYINTTPIKGIDQIVMPLLRHRLGMPSPRNVLVPSLMVALWLGYKTVYTAGVEHSWHNQLWVNDDNYLMINDTHYYDNSQPGYVRHGNFTVDKLFYSLHLAFGSYHVINRFAKTLNSNIFNVTEGSFIDAFERRKI